MALVNTSRQTLTGTRRSSTIPATARAAKPRSRSRMRPARRLELSKDPPRRALIGSRGICAMRRRSIQGTFRRLADVAAEEDVGAVVAAAVRLRPLPLDF